MDAARGCFAPRGLDDVRRAVSRGSAGTSRNEPGRSGGDCTRCNNELCSFGLACIGAGAALVTAKLSPSGPSISCTTFDRFVRERRGREVDGRDDGVAGGSEGDIDAMADAGADVDASPTGDADEEGVAGGEGDLVPVSVSDPARPSLISSSAAEMVLSTSSSLRPAGAGSGRTLAAGTLAWKMPRSVTTLNESLSTAVTVTFSQSPSDAKRLCARAPTWRSVAMREAVLQQKPERPDSDHSHACAESPAAVPLPGSGITYM